MTREIQSARNGVGPSRRTLLVGAGGLAAAHLAGSEMGMPYVGNAAAAQPIRIGMIWAKTGPVVDQSEYLSQGCYIALEDHRNQLLGRPVEVVWLDEPNPQSAQVNAQRLVDEYKVSALIGGNLSSNALAIADVAKRSKIPYVAANGAATDLTGKACNRYTFRTQPPVDPQSRALAPHLLGYGKKWYFITSAVAFGQDIKKSFGDFLAKSGGTVVGADDVTSGTSDFSSFILKIRQAKPDVLVGGLAGADLTTFLKQWVELGMKDKIPFAEIAIGDTDIWGLGAAAATGIFTKMWYYNNPNNTEADKAFTATYTKKFSRPPADKAWMGWIGMRCLLESIEAAKSTEPAAVVAALEKWSFQDGDLSVGFRDWDHQLLRRILVVKTKSEITDKWDYFDVAASLPISPADIGQTFGGREESACKMDGL